MSAEITDWIKIARERGAKKLLLRSFQPPVIETSIDFRVLAEPIIQPDVLLSFALSLFKKSGIEEDITRVQSSYFPIRSRWLGELRIQVFRQRNQLSLVIHICNHLLPSLSDLNLSTEALSPLNEVGLHLICGPSAELLIFSVVSDVSNTVAQHPIMISHNRQYQLPQCTSVIELKLDSPSVDAALTNVSKSMPSQVAINSDITPQALLSILKLSVKLPVWVSLPNITKASSMAYLSANTTPNLHTMTQHLISKNLRGVFDETGYLPSERK